MRIWLAIDALCRAAKRPSRRGLRRVAVSCRPAAAVPSAGHPVLTRARAIHGALFAAPGRQDTAHPDINIVASVAKEPNHVGGVAPTYAGRAYEMEEHTSELQSLMRNSYAVFCFN